MAQNQRTLAHRPSLRPGTTSATQTQTELPVLRLRATSNAHGSRVRPRIQWAEDVVDNEGMGRKKSKVCCIYHAPRAVGESSSESSSDSSSDDDSDGGGGDDGKARMSGHGRKPSKRRRRQQDDEERHSAHDHDHEGSKQPCHTEKQTKSKISSSTRSRKSRNAYETQPKPPRGGKNSEVKS